MTSAADDRPAPPAAPGRSADHPAYADTGSTHYAMLLALMCVVVILSGIGAAKGVVFGPIITDGGFFLFPAAYICGDVISEIYGGRAARRAILASFGANVLSVLCYAIIIVLPGFDDAYGVQKQAALEVALGPVWQVVLAGILGFLAGQNLNTLVMVAMKRRTREKRLIGRLVSSTGAGEFVDTLVFCTVAATAIGITTVEQWANYTFFGFVYKVAVQYAVMPITAAVIGWIKKREPTYQAALGAAAAGEPEASGPDAR